MSTGMMKTFIAAMKFGRPYAGLLNLVSVPTDPRILFLFKKIVNSGFPAGHLADLRWCAFAAAGLPVLRSAVVYAGGWLFHWT
jgi:hypothetical protein